MAHGYRTLQHWNQWLHKHALGNSLLDAERQLFASLLKQHLGKHAVLLGVPQQRYLLNASALPMQTLISPLAHREVIPGEIEANFHDLPILTASIDLVMLPHSLEFVENPRRLLAEACRIVKPEGLIIITGFNPMSMWGISRLFKKQHVRPWAGNFISAHKVKSWLRLHDFHMESQRYLMFRPPIENDRLFKRLAFMEKIGRFLYPYMGGVYVMVARAKVIPVTPIRMQWKQRLSGLRISPTITGTIARTSDTGIPAEKRGNALLVFMLRKSKAFACTKRGRIAILPLWKPPSRKVSGNR